jgi:hypothetical protein
MACQTCLAPLNTIGDPPIYLHPTGGDTDGHQPIPIPADRLHTIARRCDFCGDPHPVWTLEGDEVAALTVGDAGGFLQNFGHRWAACATCQHLIDSNRTDRLIGRAADALGWQHDPTGRARIAQLHTAFLRHRRPGRTLITTTGWPASTIEARQLPKIRDRLARLYRSRDGLPSPHGDRQTRIRLADALDRAGLYWVDPDFTDLADHAIAGLPDTAIGQHLMPAADGLLVWAHPITDRHAHAATWTTTDRGWRLTAYRSVGAGLDGVALQHLREHIGWLVPTTATDIAEGHQLTAGDPAAVLVVTWLLIAQQLAETRPAGIDPTIRKAYTRARRPAPEVTLVHVRRQARRDNTGRTPVGATGRAYTQRFWVSGHWRNQAYGPRRSLRRPVYINPYLRKVRTTNPSGRPAPSASSATRFKGGRSRVSAAMARQAVGHPLRSTARPYR